MNKNRNILFVDFIGVIIKISLTIPDNDIKRYQKPCPLCLSQFQREV